MQRCPAIKITLINLVKDSTPEDPLIVTIVKGMQNRDKNDVTIQAISQELRL